MHRISATAMALLVLTACDSEIVGTLGDLMEIRNSIVEIIDSGNVAVNVHNGVALGVVIANSSLNSRSSEERSVVADRVARIAYDEYSNRESLEAVHVAFTSHQRKLLIVTIRSTIESFQYPADVLRGPPGSG